MSQSICVLISGCGFLDGAEVHESVLTLLSFSKRGAKVTVAAPHKPQMHVVNHHSGEEVGGAVRMVHEEAARIARGPVVNVADVDVSAFDALFLPGGFVAAKNLSSFAVAGTNGSVDPDVSRLISAFHDAGKPIGAVCIAPAVLAMVLGKGCVTIGSDEGTAEAIDSMGATHKICPVTEMVVDAKEKLVTAPAYMCDANIHEVSLGIDKAVEEILNLCG